MFWTMLRWVYALSCVIVSEAFLKNGLVRRTLAPFSIPIQANLPFVTTRGVAPLSATWTPAAAFATDLATSLPISLEVTNAAYLAVLLGTFVPVTFLIVLYSQSEARKAGMRASRE